MLESTPKSQQQQQLRQQMQMHDDEEEVIEDETTPLEVGDLNLPNTTPRQTGPNQYQLTEDAGASCSNYMMSPPQSQTKSTMMNDQHQLQQINIQQNSATDAAVNMMINEDSQSLNASLHSAKHRTGAPFSMNSMNMVNMPPEGDPKLESSALSQKQFIIKKQSGSHQQRVTSGPYKRTSSKGPGAAAGAGHLKAYFPKLIKTSTASANARTSGAGDDGTTPTHGGGGGTGTNAAAASYKQMGMAVGGSGGSGNPRQRKFGKISRSQHGSNSHFGSTNGGSANQQRLMAMQQQRAMNNGSGVFIPTDLSNQIANERNPMESTSRSLIIVDDYQRQAIGLSQEEAAQSQHASNHNANNSSSHVKNMHRQRSQVRPANQLQQQEPNLRRRNSFAGNKEAGGTGANARTMLPPIFSGPQKKNSHKAKALAPLPPNSKKHQQQQQIQTQHSHYQQYRSQLSDCSPIDQQYVKAANMEEPGSGLLVNYPPQQNATDEDLLLSQQPKKAVNFVKKNEERLRKMQEQRAQELKNIEDQRSKLLRRQEKLKQNVLRDAQAYKALKAERAEKEQVDDQEDPGIKLGNMKYRGAGQTSPPRNPTSTKTAFGAGVSSPKECLEGQPNSAAAEEEKTEEERAEEKKKIDMMRKFYRNRHSSFLQALAEQKAKKEQEEKALQDKQEKKKQKIKQKVVGDGSQIRSKLFESKAARDDQADTSLLQEVPTPLAGLNAKQLNSTSKSSTTTAASNKKRVVNRGNSISSLSQADKAYNDNTTVATSSGNKVQRQGQGSRGSSRATSCRGTPKERNIIAANRSATSFTRGARQNSTSKPSHHNGSQQPQNIVAINAEEQLEFDEKREEEILKEAAERKARAQAIRERQEKQLAMIREKVAKEKEEELKKAERKKKLQDQAREAVVQRAEEIKNMPSLREQQDSRLKKRRGDDDDRQLVSSPSPGKPPAKPMTQDTEAFNNFLERNKTYIKTVQLNITDIKEWRKRNRVDADTKVFIIKGGYGDVKRALKQRGWVENKEKDSPCFDFLWTLMTKDVQHNSLQPGQIVNHFPTATSITTKVGLTHSLKNLIWFNSVDIDTFYPRCYDLAMKEELDDFIQEFKQVKAVSYIKIYVREMREAFQKSGSLDDLKSATVTDKIYKVAMKVCKQRTRDLDDLIDDPMGFESLVSDREWAVLSTDEHTEETLAAVKHDRWLKKQQDNEAKLLMGKGPKVTKKKQKEARDQAKATREASKAKAAQAVRPKEQQDDEDDEDEYDDEDYEYDQESDDEDTAGAATGAAAEEKPKEKAASAEEQGADEYDDEYGDYGDEDNAVIAEDKPAKATTSATGGAVSKKKSAAKTKQDNEEGDEDEDDNVYAKPSAFVTQPKQTQEQKEADTQLTQRYPKFAEALKVLELLREKFPQINLDGERNIWIMKPAGSSRGRGICLKRDLCEILDLIKFKDSNQLISNQKNGQLYICQKYIENSLIMKNRKFDIRQWVLVTDWNPLTIWIYAEPYIRFPAADFDFNKISNRYAHLSNNSIAKYGHKVHVTHKIEGNMWDLEQFQNYLQQTYGFDVWEDKIVDGIKNIVINSLESVQDNFESKKGVPFEMFGYDVMVDDDFNCWLIEVNSSPAMDYSTDVTERLVKMVLEDTVKVVIDYGLASAKKQKKVDTGGFECVYKAKRIVEKPLNSFGLNIEVQGRKIPRGHLKKY